MIWVPERRVALNPRTPFPGISVFGWPHHFRAALAISFWANRVSGGRIVSFRAPWPEKEREASVKNYTTCVILQVTCSRKDCMIRIFLYRSKRRGADLDCAVKFSAKLMSRPFFFAPIRTKDSLWFECGGCKNS